ncbi:hypothetical protein K439DRAFT_1637203 [Ramaria rubella]|nr:hypothetical protein K439DRAFT_1637203 [Ramaria rubella]
MPSRRSPKQAVATPPPQNTQIRRNHHPFSDRSPDPDPPLIPIPTPDSDPDPITYNFSFCVCCIRLRSRVVDY